MLIDIDGDLVQTDNILKMQIEDNKIIISFLYSANYMIIEAKTKPISKIYEEIVSYWNLGALAAPKISL